MTITIEWWHIPLGVIAMGVIYLIVIFNIKWP